MLQIKNTVNFLLDRHLWDRNDVSISQRVNLKEYRKAGTTLSVCLTEVSVKREPTVVCFKKGCFTLKSAHKANKLSSKPVIKSQGWGFPLATINMAPGYFHRKIEEK